MSNNPNFVWARALIDELARAGLRHVCIAPGSRSTPLVFASAHQPDLTIHRHLDERSAAFFALGLAQAARAPVALICTSGSALANFYPAVIEAHEARIPLIILTGDRPHELRASGANQTIDQIEFFGKYACWFVDLPLPEADPEPLTLRYLRTTAARAYAAANGQRKGVVHLNFPFRKPLEPTPADLAIDHTAEAQPITTITRPAPAIQPTDLTALIDLIQQHERGILIAGTNIDPALAPDLHALAHQIGYPVFADPLSGARFGHPNAIAAYETFLNGETLKPPAPDLVIRLGDVPTSKWLNNWIDTDAVQHYIHISADRVWSDDQHRVTHMIHADPAALITALPTHLPARTSAWNDHVHALERAIWEAINQHLTDFDAAYVHDLIASLPDNAILFAGNSLPIRHVDQFGRPSGKNITVYGNRGASGIDGNVSTALGIARAHPDQPVYLLIGDITLYHDMNGLLAIRNLGIDNFTIVLLNNDGGGIFNRLPVSALEPTFTDLFIMPHGLDFTHAARLYGLEHARITDRAHFRTLIAQSPSNPRLLEIRTDARHDEAARKALIHSIYQHICSQEVH